jgi:hypothetical protein
MLSLTLEAPANKQVFVVLTKKEDNPLVNEGLYNLCEDLIEKKPFNFVTVDIEGAAKFNPKSIAKLLGKCPVESHGIDFPLAARGYLEVEIDALKEQVGGLEAEYSSLDPASFKAQNLDSWISMLHTEIAEKERSLVETIKPKWIVKRILDIAGSFTDEEEIYVLHFAPEAMIPTLKALFDTIPEVSCAVLDANAQVLEPAIFSSQRVTTRPTY